MTWCFLGDIAPSLMSLSRKKKKGLMGNFTIGHSEQYSIMPINNEWTRGITVPFFSCKLEKFLLESATNQPNSNINRSSSPKPLISYDIHQFSYILWIFSMMPRGIVIGFIKYPNFFFVFQISFHYHYIFFPVWDLILNYQQHRGETASSRLRKCPISCRTLSLWWRPSWWTRVQPPSEWFEWLGRGNEERGMRAVVPPRFSRCTVQQLNRRLIFKSLH